jgi:hypothetical protein
LPPALYITYSTLYNKPISAAAAAAAAAYNGETLTASIASLRAAVASSRQRKHLHPIIFAATRDNADPEARWNQASTYVRHVEAGYNKTSAIHDAHPPQKRNLPLACRESRVWAAQLYRTLQQ